MTLSSSAAAVDIARQIAGDYEKIGGVTAVVLAGSMGANHADAGSDIDLYVYSVETLPAETRENLIAQRSGSYAVNNQFWETGDEWLERESGLAVDVTYRSPNWIEEQLERVLVRCEASTGYSTCFWYNVLYSDGLFDRTGWYAGLQSQARRAYPEALRRAIIAKNYPILRTLLLSAYSHQLEKAVKRSDWVSVNHRIAALLASYFDIVFAVNHLPHPGEKKLIALAEQHCPHLPVNMRVDIETVLGSTMSSADQLPVALQRLLDHLDELLVAEGLLIPSVSSERK